MIEYMKNNVKNKKIQMNTNNEVYFKKFKKINLLTFDFIIHN